MSLLDKLYAKQRIRVFESVSETELVGNKIIESMESKVTRE